MPKEKNAIYNGARIGIALKGCIMYVPWFPCIECSKAIIQSGIARLVTYQPIDSDERWASEFRVAKQMFAESAIIVNMIEKIEELPNGEGSGDLRVDAEVFAKMATGTRSL
ncbi:MAG: hypothetical protein JO110_19775, partial [Acetobacteraceae bacterium]|nr:hypothetical protein [Acetobacteraceae bacterium]